MATKCDIGLVMAGAVSAGAYTAGVLDFFVQALDEWQLARDQQDPSAPPHQINLKVITGASAGGMSAAILAGVLAGRPYQPIGNVDPGTQVSDNVLFQSWVNDIDIEPLLGLSDLQTPQPLMSLLDSSVLDQIADKALTPEQTTARKPWVDDDLELLLTLGNLRGIPYNIPFAEDNSGEPAQERPGHGMRQHRDYLHFSFAAASSAVTHTLDWQGQHANWGLLRQGALATGAFPLGLKPRDIPQSGEFYDHRSYQTEGPGKLDNGDCLCVIEPEIQPAWGGTSPADYQFVSVDGGVFDNEPYELARARLNANKPEVLSADQTTRFMLAIDPFPDTKNFASEEYKKPDSLLAVLLNLINAMKNQGRFKPAELATAARHISASRRIIAPSRDGTKPDQSPIASGLLGGFSGFLERSFRFHDFMLGRANAQQFLRDHFTLPPENQLISQWTDAQRLAHSNNAGQCPVIPLFGSAMDEVIVPAWPKMQQQRIDKLQKLVKKRINKMLPELFKIVVPGNSGFRKLAVWVSRLTQTGDWTKRGFKIVIQQLQDNDLISK